VLALGAVLAAFVIKLFSWLRLTLVLLVDVGVSLTRDVIEGDFVSILDPVVRAGL